MTDLSIQEKIIAYTKDHPELKSLPQERIVSIMTSKGQLTSSEAKNWYAQLEKSASKTKTQPDNYVELPKGGGQPLNASNSTFGKGFNSNFEVIPQWQTQQPQQEVPTPKKYNPQQEREFRNYASNYLYDSANSAIKMHNDYVNSYGLFSTDEIFKEMKDVANLFDFSDDGRGITTLKEMANILNAEQQNANKIKNIEHKKGAFEYQFEKTRKVPFSSQNMEEFQKKSEEYTKATAYKEKYDNLTTGISDIKSIIRAEQEYKQAKKYTKGPALASLTPPEISSNQKFGEVLLDFCNGDKELLNKYMSKITEKMGSKEEIEKNYPKILDELQQNCKKGYQKQLLGKSYEQYTNEYESSFKKAFGNENVEELTKGYIENQKMGASYTKMGIVIASTIMLGGSNIVASGASRLAGNVGVKTAGAIVKGAMTAVPIVENAAIDVVGAVTSKNGLTQDRMGEILEEQKASLPYMVFGAYAAGPLGESVKTFFKSSPKVLPDVMKKVFSNVPKTASGAGLAAEISADTFFHTVWEGTSLLEAFKVEGQTDAGMKAVNKIMTALIGGRANAAASNIMQKANLKDYKITEHTEANGQKTYTVKGPDGKVMKTDAEGLIVGVTDKVAEAVKETSAKKVKTNSIEVENEVKPLENVKPDTPSSKENPSIIETKKATEIPSDKILTRTAFKTIEIDPSKPLMAKSSDGKSILTEYGEKILRDTSDDIHIAAKTNEPVIVELMQKLDLGVDKENMVHRAKSAQSVYDKIRNAMLDEKHPMTYEDAVKSVRDAVGTRTTLGDFDYKKYPEIVEMYKTNPQKAIEMASEKQSDYMKESVATIILSQAAEKGDISALKLTNYKGKDGIPYFSDAQVAELRDLAAQHKIDLSIKDETSKVRPSGYTALQMNFKTKEGFTFEWQLRGKSVDKFAECEHVAYDAREGKDITGGNPVLKKLYEPAETSIKNMSKADFKEYNSYLTKHYEYLRKKELGFDAEKPDLPEKFDNHLQADALEILHDIAVDLKAGKITEVDALSTYHKLTDEFADWALRQEPQIGDFVGVKSKGNEADASVKLSVAETERIKLIKDKAEISENAAENIAKMNDECFDYIKLTVAEAKNKVDRHELSFLSDNVGELVIAHKNLDFVKDAELRSKLTTLEATLRGNFLDGDYIVKQKDIKGLSELVLNVATVDDTFVIKYLNNKIDDFMKTKEYAKGFDESLMLIDALNGATGKTAQYNGDVHKAYKKIVDVEIKNAASRDAAAKSSVDVKSEITDRLSKVETDNGRDFTQSVRFEGLKKYILEHGKTNPEMAKHLYEKYYSSTMPEKVRSVCNSIGNEFNTRLFLIDGKDLSSAKTVQRELSLWKEASDGKVVYPATLDLSKIQKDFIDTNTAGVAYYGSKRISLKGHGNIDYALRHEMLHINDNLKCETFGKYGARKEYDFREESSMLKEKTWNRDEFRKAGINEGHIDYAYTNRAEFIAVAAEGDFTKYSPEFKKLLVELGMPEWVQKLPKNQFIDRLKAEYKGTEQEAKINDWIKLSEEFSYNKLKMLAVVDNSPEKINNLIEILSLKEPDGSLRHSIYFDEILSLDKEKLEKISNFAKLQGRNGNYIYSYALDKLADLPKENLNSFYKLAECKDKNGDFVLNEYVLINLTKNLKNINSINDKVEIISTFIRERSDLSWLQDSQTLDNLLLQDRGKLDKLMEFVQLKDSEGDSPYTEQLSTLVFVPSEKLPTLLKFAELKADEGGYLFDSYKFELDQISSLEKNQLAELYEIVSNKGYDSYTFKSQVKKLSNCTFDKMKILGDLAQIKGDDGSWEYDYYIGDLAKIETEKLNILADLAKIKNADGTLQYSAYAINELSMLPQDKLQIFNEFTKIKDENGKLIYHRYDISELEKKYSVDEFKALYQKALEKDENGQLIHKYRWDLQ